MTHPSQTAHAPTPGPWLVKESSNPINGKLWRDIVSLGDSFGPSYVGEALECDAYLIAAAPDLLAALKKLLSALQPGAREGSVQAQVIAMAQALAQAQAIARAAIDKAENRIA